MSMSELPKIQLIAILAHRLKKMNFKIALQKIKIHQWVFGLIVFTYVYCIFNLENFNKKTIVNNDVIQYYSYLPAFFIEQDMRLTFLDNPDYKIIPDRYWHLDAPNGGNVFKYSMGEAILILPFFTVANVYAHFFDGVTDGFSEPYQLAICMANVFYVLLGFWLLMKLLLELFDNKTVAITLLSIAIGTNLFYYVIGESGMSHAFSFFLFSSLLFVNSNWHKNPSFKNSTLLGLVAGLIVLTRPSNGLVLLLPLLYKVTNVDSLKKQVQFFIAQFQKLIIITLVAIITLLPQFIYWKYVTGSWVFYSYLDESFFLSSPHILEVLFSFRKGLFIYTPLMVFAFVGIHRLYKTKSQYFFAVLTFTLLNIYLVSSWWCWWYGGGFGLRAFIESFAILSIPLASFIHYISQQNLLEKLVVRILLTTFILLNIFETYQYRKGVLHYDSMSFETYIKIFGRTTYPDGYDKSLNPANYELAKQNKEVYEWR